MYCQVLLQASIMDSSKRHGCGCGASACHQVTHETWECAKIYYVSLFWIMRATHLPNAVNALRHKALIYASKLSRFRDPAALMSWLCGGASSLDGRSLALHTARRESLGAEYLGRCQWQGRRLKESWCYILAGWSIHAAPSQTRVVMQMLGPDDGGQTRRPVKEAHR